jgi:hypothetical protein
MGSVTDAEEQIRQELERLQPVIEEITGLPSRWNGSVELLPNPGFNGIKRPSCMIAMDVALVGNDLRWRTSIHELLHAVSAGNVPSDYRLFRGWEEGVVEQFQRLIRPSLLARIGVVVPEEVFRAAERVHPFNQYIEALEKLRERLRQPEFVFYRNLLRTPIRSRPTTLYELRGDLPGDDRKRFMETFARAHATLRR